MFFSSFFIQQLILAWNLSITRLFCFEKYKSTLFLHQLILDFTRLTEYWLFQYATINFMFEKFSTSSKGGLNFDQVHAKFTGWLVDLDLLLLYFYSQSWEELVGKADVCCKEFCLKSEE